MEECILFFCIPLVVGWLADLFLGDPPQLPHPVVGFGKVISWGEKRWNKGKCRQIKGGVFSVILILSAFFLIFYSQKLLGEVNRWLAISFSAVIVFYCLAGKTLIQEVRQVFIATDITVEEGRKQVARIVGRDTSNLNVQQIRTAALETLSENLSDGVIAPLFWYMLLGVPGMFAYKMVNTLDSMIGYKNERFKQFGCWAAHIDDIANFIPARLTACLMILVSGSFSAFTFLKKYGRNHSSPNSGYPEAALAGILNCRFGGASVYFGQMVDKPYIGENSRELTTVDMQISVRINRWVEIGMLILVLIFGFGLNMIV